MQKKQSGKKSQSCLECQILKAENEKLRHEIDRLKQLILDAHISNQLEHEIHHEVSDLRKSAVGNADVKSELYENSLPIENPSSEQMLFLDSSSEILTKDSSLSQKIALFRNLFKGREDVYAKRYDNKISGKTGYTPVCKNEWENGICAKPKMKCQDCPNKDYVAINDQIIKAHFFGEAVFGLYALPFNETEGSSSSVL